MAWSDCWLGSAVAKAKVKAEKGAWSFPKVSWRAAPNSIAASTLSALPTACLVRDSLTFFSSHLCIAEHFTRHVVMPKVNSYAPAWLCRPSPGASFFTSASVKSPAQDLRNGNKTATPSRAARTVARRGNEVFVVVDNEIRWSNLARLKDQWHQQSRQKQDSVRQTKATTNGGESSSYRVSTIQPWISRCFME